jgi:mono/diheme cytochrome c family protein
MLHTTALMAAMLLSQVQYRQCQTSAGYAQVQQVQTYTQPVQTYAQQYNNYVEKVLFLPIEREDPYYATIVHDKLRQEERAKEKIQGETDLATQVSKLSESIVNLEKRFGELLGTPSPLTPQPNQPATPSEPANPTPTAPVTPTPPQPPTPSGPDSASVTQLKADVTKLFVDNCAKCHTGESSAKGFVMFDDNDKLRDFLALEKVLIETDIHSGKMPKNAKPMLDADYSKIRAWVGLDHVNIRKALEETLKKGQ